MFNQITGHPSWHIKLIITEVNKYLWFEGMVCWSHLPTLTESCSYWVAFENEIDTAICSRFLSHGNRSCYSPNTSGSLPPRNTDRSYDKLWPNDMPIKWEQRHGVLLPGRHVCNLPCSHPFLVTIGHTTISFISLGIWVMVNTVFPADLCWAGSVRKKQTSDLSNTEI